MSTSTPTRQKNLGWLWFFLLLAVLAISATVVLIVYNNQQQLKPEQIETARARWREKGPRDYRLVYNIKVNEATGETHTDQYDVSVMGGVVTRASCNGKAQPAERLHDHGMDRLLELVADKMAIDRDKDRPRTFTRAMFDPNNGALFWYVRRVMGSKERIEITVEKIASP